MSEAVIHQLSVSAGGVPKLAIEVGEVTSEGMAGDRQAKPGIHGGPYRALCLFPLEVIEELRAGGHPIEPGGVGENVTTSGLDWSAIEPGTHLRLGAELLIEITSFTDPCKTIAANFSDGNMNRINQRVAPGKSRVYARVLKPGSVRAGDAIAIETSAEPFETSAALAPGLGRISQLAIPVGDLDRSIQFYGEQLGASFLEEVYGLAFFDFDGVRLMLEGPDHGDERPPAKGTIYFHVDNINVSYEALLSRGVQFDVPPLVQVKSEGVERWMAFYRDPDGNRLALVSLVPTA